MLIGRLKSISYAIKGIFILIKEEENARLHCFAGLVVVSAGWYFDVSSTEWCFLAGAIAAVFSAEAMNTAIENLTDLVSPDHHPLAGKTKDVAAGGVLLVSIGAAVIGSIIFLPKIISFFF